MEIILFILVLGVLILIHELGHFITAKKLGVRVDEFGIGFPPRLFAFKKGETEYSLNIIPLGGFVKIFGEDPDDDSLHGPDKKRSLVNKPRWAQAMVISAGVIFNVVFAWLLISFGFMSGLPVSVSQYDSEYIEDAQVVIVDMLKDSPAEKAGLQIGDKVLFVGAGMEAIQKFNQAEMSDFINLHGNEELTFLYKRGEEQAQTALIQPVEGISEGRFAVGVVADSVGVVKLPFLKSFIEGSKLTVGLIASTTVGLFVFVKGVLTGTAGLSQISGPVGIVGMVGDAAEFGFIYLLSFTALISINLAVLNSIPFPALDGGRLLFILVESVSRKKIKPIILNSLNLMGFALLMLLMVAVTYNDILKLF